MKTDMLYFLLIGTYTRTNNDGIYVYSFNAASGEVAFVSKTSGVKNPSYLAVSPDKKFVFAVNESGEKTGDHVSSFAFDNHKGMLDAINKVSSGGIDPCYLSTNASASKIFVANYSSGSLSEISVDSHGHLNSSIYTIQFTGKSINAERQAGSHIHATVFSPGFEYLFVTDLGADKIKTYQVKNDLLKLLTEKNVRAGSGPRHLVFNASGSFAYLVLELDATISVFAHHEGSLDMIQTVKMVPDNFTGTSSAADIHLSHDGQFLYASNRGTANDIVVFAVDQSTGKVSYVDRTPSLGTTPRNFIIDPTDNFLLVAHQESNDIFIFKRDLKTGRLKHTGNKIQVEAPVCLQLTEAV